jgi:hypothetical protein
MKRLNVLFWLVVGLTATVAYAAQIQENDGTTPPPTMELQTGETVSSGVTLTSHQRLFRAEALVADLSLSQKLDTLGHAWNQASIEQRKDMVTILLEDDSHAFVPKSVYSKRYDPSTTFKVELAETNEKSQQSSSSLLELYGSMQDIHRLIFLQESLWPKLDKQSQQAIYSFLEVKADPPKDSRSNEKINESPIVCPNQNYLLIGRSCHLMCSSDRDCGGDHDWCSCDLEAFPSLGAGRGACTCRCDPSKYTRVKTCQNIPKNLPEDNLVCLEWFDFGICGMGGSSIISPFFALTVSLIILLLTLY